MVRSNLLYFVSIELTYKSISSRFHYTVGIDLPSRTILSLVIQVIILTMIKNILLVEDDADLRTLVRDQLKSIGYNVFEATNGQMALRIMADQSVDLVITDIDMPVKNGLELLEEVQLIDGEIPVVVMTGGNYNETLIMQAGAKAFVQKPFVNDIASIIKKVTAA